MNRERRNFALLIDVSEIDAALTDGADEWTHSENH